MSFEKVPNFLANFFEAEMNANNSSSYRFNSFLLNVAERQLSGADGAVPLTPKAFDVLVYLVSHGGHLVHKDELMQAVWPDSFVDEVNLPRTVHTLRRALGEDDNGNKFIETIPTKGYRFVADVTTVNGHERSPEVSDVARPDEAVKETTAELAAVRPNRSNPLMIVPALSVLVVLVVGSYLFFSKRLLNESGQRRSIAVLPFVNDTGEDDRDYLVDGITENVINNLSR